MTNGIRQKEEGKGPNGRKGDDVKRWTKEEREDKEEEVKEEKEGKLNKSKRQIGRDRQVRAKYKSNKRNTIIDLASEYEVLASALYCE